VATTADRSRRRSHRTADRQGKVDNRCAINDICGLSGWCGGRGVYAFTAERCRGLKCFTCPWALRGCASPDERRHAAESGLVLRSDIMSAIDRLAMAGSSLASLPVLEDRSKTSGPIICFVERDDHLFRNFQLIFPSVGLGVLCPPVVHTESGGAAIGRFHWENQSQVRTRRVFTPSLNPRHTILDFFFKLSRHIISRSRLGDQRILPTRTQRKKAFRGFSFSLFII